MVSQVPEPLDLAAWLESLRDEWNTDYGTASHELRPCETDLVGRAGSKYLRLATGGWSENEEILDSRQGSMEWLLTWVFSARGGLYVFEYPQDVGT